MAFQVLTLDELHRIALDVRASIMPGADIAEDAPFWKDDRVQAALTSAVHAALFAVSRDSIPDTAEGEGLTNWGRVIDRPANGPTISRAVAGLQVKGDVGAAIPSGAALTGDESGLQIETVNADVVGASGSTNVDVISIDTGLQVNFAAGTVFSWNTPPPLLETKAKLILPMAQGLDQESEASHQARVANFFSQPPQGGNANDYVQTALEVPEIVQAYVLKGRAGAGSVDIVAFHAGEGGDRILNLAERAALLLLMESFQPVSDLVRIVETVSGNVDVTVDVLTDGLPENEPDWDDGGSLEILTWTAGTRQIQTTTDLPVSLTAGDRFCIERPVLLTDSTGAVRVVEAIISADTFSVLEPAGDPLGFTPVATDKVHAAGAVTETVREAIINGYERAGGVFEPGINQFGPANPSAVYGTWVSAADPARIQAAAFAQPGVFTATAILPASTIEAVDPAQPGPPPPPDDTVTTGFIVPGQVLVRLV